MIGFAVGASEEQAFWLDFVHHLVCRGLNGVRLVTSDAHEGLNGALEQVLPGGTWQRCRVHLMRNVLAHVPKGDKAMVAAMRTIFAQPNRDAAGQQLLEVMQAMQLRWPNAARVLERGADDILNTAHGFFDRKPLIL